LTASAIIFSLSSAGVPISRAHSKYNGAVTWRTAAFFARRAAKFTWSTAAERHRHSQFEVVIPELHPKHRSRSFTSFSKKRVRARTRAQWIASVPARFGLANRDVIATRRAVTASRRSWVRKKCTRVFDKKWRSSAEHRWGQCCWHRCCWLLCYW
jgi:hypothetical protein